MTKYEIDCKLKELENILANVKKLGQEIRDYNELIALDGSSFPDKTEILSIFDNILSEIKYFEDEDSSDIVFWAEVIAEDLGDARDYFVEEYLTNAEIDAYIESVSKNIAKMSDDLSAEEFRPQKQSYDHSEVKEARYA